MWLVVAMEKPRFFDPRDEVEVMVNRLPHWQQAGGIIFLTFRLADSLPAELLRPWQSQRKVWLKQYPPPHTPDKELEYHRLFTVTMEQALDAGHGSCVLRNRRVAEQVAGTFHFYESRRSELFSLVVMPNHVHALFGLVAHTAIDALLKDWKSYSSHVLVKQSGEGWPGWQKDYFDRLVRNEAHFERCVRYIRSNPKKAGLKDGEFLLWEAERAKAVL